MRSVPIATAAMTFAFLLTTGCSKKSPEKPKNGPTTKESARPQATNQANCKNFCTMLDKCADQVAEALVSDLPEGPKKLFKGKLMAHYKNPARCTKDCEQARKTNPGKDGALDRCKDSKDCKALAECLHQLSIERRKKIPSAQRDKELKEKGARKAAELEKNKKAGKTGLKPGGPRDNAVNAKARELPARSAAGAK